MWHAEIALSACDGQPSMRDRAFYRGKVTAATFFAMNVLPRLGAERRAIETTELAAMELEAEAF
ncbi:acyl-CoA dehydrogenase C-terminal domain-containing protein [Mycolicibacterium sp.]|uniref:acyl-CoA dehydrogenase C-terminal domain-containing protein n=1 Tax=Mycolicibacterium sp. TaxID=2320850 RepID=UPI0025FEFF18|nr:acyl-CoA dehydrogenase C-terminal domain-containing protein [Mycolicibacterium sp.]